MAFFQVKYFSTIRPFQNNEFKKNPKKYAKKII